MFKAKYIQRVEENKREKLQTNNSIVHSFPLIKLQAKIANMKNGYLMQSPQRQKPTFHQKDNNLIVQKSLPPVNQRDTPQMAGTISKIKKLHSPPSSSYSKNLTLTSNRRTQSIEHAHPSLRNHLRCSFDGTKRHTSFSENCDQKMQLLGDLELWELAWSSSAYVVVTRGGWEGGLVCESAGGDWWFGSFESCCCCCCCVECGYVLLEYVGDSEYLARNGKVWGIEQACTQEEELQPYFEAKWSIHTQTIFSICRRSQPILHQNSTSTEEEEELEKSILKKRNSKLE